MMTVAACGGTPPAAQQPTAAPAAQPTAAPAAAEATAAPAAAEATTAPATGGSGSATLLTVSAQQQATWTRNFNPFATDNRFPTINGIYEPSMVYNTVKGELTPWLATKYEWSSDNKKLTVTYRDNVKWSDGQAFTAKDVAFTFNLQKANKGLTGSGQNAWVYLDTVTAPSDTTAEFSFKEVYTVGLYDIVGQNIVAEHVWKDVKDPVTFTNETPVGTGPFTEVQNFQNQIYEVHKNPNYWQSGKPMIDGMRFPAYPGNDQANLATINGENDWAGNFLPDIEKTYVAKSPDNGYYFPPVGATVMLYLNTTKKPFDDVNVRKAISMAINRDQVVKVAMYGYTKPADVTGLSDAYPKYKSQAVVDAGTWTKLDIAKANELLDAAGLAKGGDGMRTLSDGTPLVYDINVVSGWSDWVSACNIIAQNLKAVGINASVKSYDYSAWYDRVQKGEFDISIGWSNGGATPLNYYRGQMSKTTVKAVGESSDQNWHRFGLDEADKLLGDFAATSDEAEQVKIAEQLEQLFSDNAPAIPLFPGPAWYEFNTSRFTGWPSKDNPFAQGSPFGSGTPEQLLVMTSVQPK
ncbi:ABC transporter substrate-binding protein [Chloroflexia bacterium SDU3-3]|nr:ABC transporter substrate-binding protein [Chloroflexia bacterium SDU3-3]